MFLSLFIFFFFFSVGYGIFIAVVRYHNTHYTISGHGLPPAALISFYILSGILWLAALGSLIAVYVE